VLPPLAHRSQRLLRCIIPLTTLALTLTFATPSSAQVAPADRLCDNAFEDCRATILEMIRNETAGIDVSYWFMTDWRYSSEIIRRWQAGVPVRILLDLRADPGYPAGASIRQSFINAGIPIRHKVTTGINHWKMMLYRGQNAVHFSAANFANGSYSPSEAGGEYLRYVDEGIYFTTDPLVVHTFMKKYDDIWTSTTHYATLANISGPLTRNYPTYSGDQLDPELNFPPDEDYQDRLIAQMRNETQQIDVAMFRITSGKVPDEMIRRVQAGVPVRLITDRRQYRNTTYFWHSYNVDRMYMTGIPIKWKDSGTDQDMHQKSVVLHGVDMAIFGSSNWTASSSDTQREHNYFTRKTWFVDWFTEQFLRKWDNTRVDGTAVTPAQYINYTPGWPETPVNVSPANVALGVASSVTLRWEGGWWAHKYDIYFGTTNPPPLIAQNFMPGSATAGVGSSKESFNPCAPPAPFVSVCPAGLAPGTTYYWKIRGKTMIGDGGGPFNAPARAISGPTWSFTTSGGAPAPSAPSNLAPSSISQTRIDLAWTDVAGEAGYKIERKLAGASDTTWAQIGTTAPDVTFYQDTGGLLPGTSYNYRVRAWTTGGHSGYSNLAIALTPAPSVEASLVLADTYVRGGQYANANYGNAAELIAKFSADAAYLREAYMMLDISGVQAGHTVRLRLFGRLSDTRAPSVTTAIVPLATSAWTETTVTWNNRPTAGADTWATVAVSGTTATWYEVDITPQVQALRAAGQTSAAIALKSTVDTLPYVTFSARGTANAPRLVITP
jgi:phosphatidylserine/phosphatidylglycerophosphate/cardiolipin synthase-like enzyme